MRIVHPTESPGMSPGTAAPAGAPGGLQLSNGLQLLPIKWGGLRGVFTGLGYGPYEKDPALRISVLSKIMVSPLYLQTSLQAGDDDSTALTLGRVFHTRALQPELEADTVVVVEASNRNTNLYKAAVAQNPGKDVVLGHEYADLTRMCHTLQHHVLAQSVLAGAAREVSVFWDDPATKVQCKARLDLLRDGTVVDLKSTRDLAGFPWDAEKYGYHRQAAWYLDGIAAATGKRFDTFLVIAVEKVAPFDLKVYELSPKLIARGRAENAANLALYKSCVDQGSWPGYPEVIEELT